MHETRVGAYQLRSTLRIFSDVVDAARAEELNNELAWYAGLPGEVRQSARAEPANEEHRGPVHPRPKR